jgi:putative Mg2+ transporter-C (MgtC) family protein
MISEIDLVIRLFASILFGGLLGIEREQRDKPAGLRTHLLVSLGACLFTILSLEAFPGADTSRIASYIVAGIGFIGAGTIIQARDKVFGITTAASLWVTASIGIAMGVGYFLAGGLTSVFAFLILAGLGRLESKPVKQESETSD